jgi:hypothetical protein
MPVNGRTTTGAQCRPPSLDPIVSPSSKTARSCFPSTLTETTGRGVRSSTCHVFPPSPVIEIVPCGLQPKAVLVQLCQPVPMSPCCGSRNAIAFGTRATRGGGATATTPALSKEDVNPR